MNNVKYDIQEEIKGILDDKKIEERNRLTEVLLTYLGQAEVEYFRVLRQTGDVYKGSDRIYEFLTTNIDELLNNNLLKEHSNYLENNKELYGDSLVNALNIQFRVERDRMDRVFDGGSGTSSLEDVYIMHLEDYLPYLPGFTTTDFIFHRDIKRYASAVQEAFWNQGLRDVALRNRTYFRYMYVLDGDPRLEEDITRLTHIDWSLLDKKVFKYIFTSRLTAIQVEAYKTAQEFYLKELDSWNDNRDYLLREESDYESAYIGSLVFKNSVFKQGKQTKAMQNTIKLVIQEAIKEDETLYAETLLKTARNQLNHIGVAIIHVGNVRFIVGKSLIVIVGEGEQARVVGEEAHSNVNKKVIQRFYKNKWIN